MALTQQLSTWPTLRWPWLVLAGSAFFLEIIALYFQYFMGLEPCVMCIYQRTALFGVALSALPAAINPQDIKLRLISYTGVFICLIWGFDIAFEHVQMQNPANFMLAMSCDAFPNFPLWFSIHEWFPAVFEARGTCDGIDWQFLTLSMPQWMAVIFAVYLLVTSALFILRLLIKRTI